MPTGVSDFKRKRKGSLYHALHQGAAHFQTMDIWKARVLSKIKIFPSNLCRTDFLRMWKYRSDRARVMVVVRVVGHRERRKPYLFKCVLAQFLWGCV